MTTQSNTKDMREEAARVFLLADLLKPRPDETLSDLKDRASTEKAPVKNGSSLEFLIEKDSTRGKLYSDLVWEETILHLSSLSVWPKMDGLPEEWCDGSVLDVAQFVKNNELPPKVNRLKKMLHVVQTEGPNAVTEWLQHLSLLAVPEAILHKRDGQRPLLTLDDGCSRAVTLGLLGIQEVRVLVGSTP